MKGEERLLFLYAISQVERRFSAASKASYQAIRSSGHEVSTAAERKIGELGDADLKVGSTYCVGSSYSKS